MTKVLVTGGTGFIGRSIVKSLIRNGNQVTILDDNSRGAISKLGEFIKEVHFIEGDIRNNEIVNYALKNIEVVVHLAYINGTEHFYTRPFEILDVGITGMLNLLKAHQSRCYSRFILASSSEVYQEPKIIPTPEEVQLVIPNVLNPRYSYGGGKIASELLLMNYAYQHKLKADVFRPHNIYGPDMGQEHVIPQVIGKIQRILAEKNLDKLEIQGTGKETRAFCFIEDFEQAFNLIFENKVTNEIYNIGNPIETSVLELVNSISEIMKFNGEIVPSDLQIGSPVRRCPDISKIESMGFVPNWDLESGLRKTIEFYDNAK
jgi:nucleoside-diphosphate-sugar epimerase